MAIGRKPPKHARRHHPLVGGAALYPQRFPLSSLVNIPALTTSTTPPIQPSLKTRFATAIESLETMPYLLGLSAGSTKNSRFASIRFGTSFALLQNCSYFGILHSIDLRSCSHNCWTTLTLYSGSMSGDRRCETTSLLY